MADTGVVVVGAGVVGLAVAARLARAGREVLLLERHERHGQETSSRNSEVIHAGLYYPPGSLKARLCVEGNRRLYERCRAHGLPHRATGKIVTAVEEGEERALEKLLAQGRECGAPLERVTGEAARAMEPAIRSREALWSPSTGVLSAHALMDDLLAEARRHGATLLERAEVVALERRSTDWRVEARTPDGVESVTAEVVVNAAGLDSDTVAGLAGIDVDAAGYRLHWVKGSYFSLSARRAGLLSRLVYPVPGQETLGVHVVVDVAGGLKFGPDMEYLAERRPDYRVDPGRGPAFAASVRKIVPAVADGDLAPDMAGIRPKLQGRGQPFHDFVIADESARGFPGLIDLVGIDSPGLTAALPIADHVAGLLAVPGSH